MAPDPRLGPGDFEREVDIATFSPATPAIRRDVCCISRADCEEIETGGQAAPIRPQSPIL